jgi:hypothetical protein
MTDRVRVSLESIVALLVPRIAAALAVYAKWEYRVTGVVEGPPVLISGNPVSSACPFGPLANITLWPGPDGAYALPQSGSLVLIEFHEGTETKPSVCGLDPNVAPLLTTIAFGTVPIALEGSTITITPAQVVAASMVAGGNPVTAGAPLQGSITTGSARVVSG